MANLNIIGQKPARLFIILGGFFITNALVAEFIGVKIFALENTFGWASWDFNLFGEIGALQFSAGVLLWPVVFILTDVINEYYGKKGIRLLSYMAAGLIAYAFVMIYSAIQLAPADWWQVQNINKGVPDMQSAFSAIFGQGLLIIVASLVAFLVAQIVDVITFHRIKKITGEKKVWLRATGSTAVSQFFDSFVVLYIAFKIGPELTGFSEPWPWSRLLAVCAIQYTYKFSIAVLLTPVIYLAHHGIDKYLGVDVAKEMKANAAL